MKNYLFIIVAWVFASCQKEDEAVVLPLPGPVQQLVAPMGSNYDDQVYVSLSLGKITVAPYRAYDLMFESSEQGMHVYLNSGKLMFASRTNNGDFFLADSTGSNWRLDAANYMDDSTAIGDWWVSAATNTNGYSHVFIIDRGRIDHSGADRFRKLQILSADDIHYEIRYSKLDNSGVTVMSIPKNPNYSLTYFSFNNNGSTVNQAPPSSDWDFVFTKYTHVYFDEPLSSPYRYYPVTGALINRWKDMSGSVIKKDSIPAYLPFVDCTYSSVDSFPFTNIANIIGFDWKYYDFGDNQYYVRPDLFYLLKDEKGNYYKVRMLDFYNQQGVKGTVTLEYQRI
jgi:HmuY protein